MIATSRRGRPLIVDCDPGIDDAIALHVVAQAVRRNAVELRGIVAVAGNAPLDFTARNAAFLARDLRLDAPVRAGCAAPLDGQSPAHALDFHGADGIGGAYPDGFSPQYHGDGCAWLISALRDARSRSERLTLLALGPLTNVATVISAVEPPDLDAVEHIIIMGGVFWRRGNITASAEFNFFIDPRAASIVCSSGVPITIVPLDVTEQVIITRADVDDLALRGASPLITKLLSASIDNYRDADRIEGCVMHDALAAALIEAPDLVRTRTGHVEIDLSGEHAGRSTFTPRASSVLRVADRVDSAAARKTILDALLSVSKPAAAAGNIGEVTSRQGGSQ